MLVIYTGNYRENSLNYKGYVFSKSEPTEVSEEWFDKNHSAKLKVVEDVSFPPGVDDKDILIAEAESLGVKIDKRWGTEKIRAAIDGYSTDNI